MCLHGEKTRLCFCMDYQRRLLFFAIFNLVITGIQLLMPLISTGIIVTLSVSDNNGEAVYMLNQQAMNIVKKPPTIENSTSPIDTNVLKSDLHIWAAWLLLHFICFCYSWALFFGVQLMCYKRCLSWVSVNVPLVSLYIMSLTMDLSMGVLQQKSLKDQVIQYAQVSYGIVSLLIVYMFLGKIERGIRKRTVRDMAHFDSPVKFQEMTEQL